MIAALNIFLLLSFSSCISSETASFYGASYISVPLPEAKTSTDISFKILTKRSDALLLFAAGETDYCLIKLTAGRLKVHINLGAGESTITSPHGLRLDDLNWHSISFLRKDADVTLTIDNIHVTREKLPGSFFTLNIHYGIFIGGQGEFSELFLGHGDWLRGCISDLVYNGVHPLQLARKRVDQAQAHDISWNCAAEFRANSSVEISFVDDGSFMSLPNLIPRTGVRWELEIKTTSTDGVLFYTTGGGENSDFVGAEIVGGKVHVILDKGGGPAEVINDIHVSDGTWHSVVINFNPNMAQLTVDKKPVKQKLTLSATKYFDLGEVVDIGGVELNKRARALGQGLKTADTSLKGCIRNIRIAMQDVGFPHAKVTQGLLASCVWSYPCNDDPCKQRASCVPRGVNSFLCLCDDDHCVKPDFPNPYTVYSKTLQLELVELSPVIIFEGQNVLITPAHINIILDYAKYGIRDSGVLFSTVPSHLPKHGRLALEVWEKSGTPQTFTLLDLIRDKVRYVHDGSESSEDTILLDLELSPGPGFVLPSYLQGQHRFSLHVNISEVNDAPSLVIPASKTLHLPAGTRKVLLPSVLNTTDPDSPRGKLMYYIVGDNQGRIEKISNLGVSISSFSQLDIDKHSVYYFNDGPPNSSSKISFQVSDGQLTSAVASLRVSVIPLAIKLMNNTGAFLPYFSYVILTSNNLTFSTNSEDTSIELMFKVVEECQYGLLELGSSIEGNDTWLATRKFSSSDLALELVRYRHTTGRPAEDKFKFKVSSLGVAFDTVYEFHLNFIELNLETMKNSPVFLNGTKEAVITSQDLKFFTTPIPSLPTNIVYTLITLPQFGNLYFDNSERLVKGDNITQADIDFNNIKYKMFRLAHTEVKDSISFEVSAKFGITRPTVAVEFIYKIPAKLPHAVESNINVLKVMEGGTSPILASELDIKVSSIKSLVYEVFSGPLHGSLSLLDQIQSATQNNVVHFTPSQIMAGRLIYSHDGSESANDVIKFIAISNVEDDFMTIGHLDVNITLINDNAPVRSVSSVFRIVKGGQRLLTTRHIKFIDNDSDFDDNNLVYTVKNGSGIFSSLTKTKLHQFTQGDLESEKVMVIESSLNGNPVLFSVSDGTHTTECYLDIRPSPSYVELTNNSHLVVSQGGQATITTSNLFSDTNIDIRLQDIRYTVTTGPSHGELIVSGIPNFYKFKQKDIEDNNVIYKHLSTSIAQDRIQLKISVQDIYTEGSLAIRVFPPIYWDPLRVVSNNTVFVEEYTSVIVRRENIQINQPGIPPSDITFLVVTGPKYGYLEIEGSEEDKRGEYEDRGGIRAFDQATVNAGKLYYVQSAANETQDAVVIDVTNGVTWLKSLMIKFVVIPSKFYLSNIELVVDEGDSIKLPPHFFVSHTPYYRDKITDYYISAPPRHGTVVSSLSNKGVSKWNVQQSKNNIIKYIHDGSETSEDSFTVIAKSESKESEPASVQIIIKPVNDMIPMLVNKTNLKLWRGGQEVLKSSNLAAVDIDTSVDNIAFVILSATGGHVAFVNDSSSSIGQFTQTDINENNIIISHDGGNSSFEMEVVISDGKNKQGPITYSSDLMRPSLELKINNGIHVFPLLRKLISRNMLLSTCSDNRPIAYIITHRPSFGRLIRLKDNEDHLIVTNFTQSHIDNKEIFYEHNTPFKESSIMDSFTFDVLANFVEPIKSNVFNIDISVFSGGLDQLFALSSTLNIEEGGTTPITINTTVVRNFLIHNVSLSEPILQALIMIPPQNGLICYMDECNATTFSQIQLDSGNILYQHDHSDTTSDFFQLSLYLEPGYVLLVNVSFIVDVHPINDQPFKLITNEPHVSVVQGQNVVITKNDLYTEDSDSEPHDIIYEIVSGPNFGSVCLHNVTTDKFTQSDIDNGFIQYRHTGSLQPISFYFRVSDKKFTPVYTVFHISVLKISLNITISKPVVLRQGTNVAQVSVEIFNLHTNANEMDIAFNLTALPKHGSVYVNDSTATKFNFRDVVAGRVTYVQENMSIANDYFVMSAFNVITKNDVIPNLRVNVNVVPLLIIGNFTSASGSRSKIDLKALDASRLAKLSKSNPTYKILKKPKHGLLKKIIRSSGEYKITREKEIMKFTHEEVQSGLIYFVSKKTIETVEDTVQFLLYATIYQPAVGELKLKIIGEAPSTTFKPPKTRIPGSVQVVEPDSVQIASPNMSDDYLLGVSLVTGVIALAFLIVGFVRCGSKHASYEDSVKSDLPDPLPRPPDDLLPSSPHIALTTPILTPPVLSLNNPGPGSLNSSEADLNLRYPYGDEDWSSFTDNGGVQGKGNPMLRKNQYWV